MLNKKFSLIICMCFLSHAAIASNDLEEAPLRVGYAGKFLKKSRDIYNDGVMQVTNLQNFYTTGCIILNELRRGFLNFLKISLRCNFYAPHFLKIILLVVIAKFWTCKSVGLFNAIIA